MTLFTLSETDKKNGGDKVSESKGMIETRSTTDVLFLILIIAVWVCMSGVGGDAVKRGNVYRLIGPMNDQVGRKNMNIYGRNGNKETVDSH